MIRYCPHCWAEIGLDDRLCPHCQQLTDENGLDFADKLIAALRHPEPTRAGLAIDILAGRLHEARAVGPLLALLASTQDHAVLAQAAHGLGQLGDQRAVQPLAKLLNNGDAPLVARREAAYALGRLGGAEAEVALIQATSDSRASVADAAWEAYHDLAMQPKARKSADRKGG
jgi:HEAT repeat protein